MNINFFFQIFFFVLNGVFYSDINFKTGYSQVKSVNFFKFALDFSPIFNLNLETLQTYKKIICTGKKTYFFPKPFEN